MTLREATWRDLRTIHILEKICFGRDAWPWFDVLAALLYPETVRILASISDEVIGFVFGDRRRRKGVGWIASIGVHPRVRRQGIGRLLMESCEQELGMKKVRLALRPSNHAAKSLYLKTGYVETDLWKRYYWNGEDALVMEKEIDLKSPSTH